MCNYDEYVLCFWTLSVFKVFGCFFCFQRLFGKYWMVGRLDGWKAGRSEGWKAERLEGKKVKRLEGWKVGRSDD